MLTHRALAQFTPAGRPFSREGWIFELRYDGFRAFGAKEDERIRLVSSRGTDLLKNYPEIGTALGALPSFVLDAEFMIFDALKRPQFEMLRRRFSLMRGAAIRQSSESSPAVLLAFDLLQIGGLDIRRDLFSAARRS